MSGELSVLNCGKGDIRIKLDKENPIEVLKAKRMIQDMLKRGYLLAIEGKGGKLIPVDSFDAETGEYIVCEGALYSGGESPPESEEQTEPAVEAKPTKGKAKRTTKRVPMTGTKATAVPMTAGG